MIIVHYEIYVFEKRGWVLRSRYPQGERAAAIDKARNLERQLRLFVRVFSETYNSTNSSVEELEIYSSSNAPAFTSNAGRSHAKSLKGDAGSGAVYFPDLNLFSAKSGLQKGHVGTVEVMASTQVAVRAISIIALALLGSGVLVALVPSAIEILLQLGFHIRISKSTYSSVLFFVFFITFLIIAVPLAVRFLPRLNLGLDRDDEEDDDDDPEKKHQERDLRKSLDSLTERAVKDKHTK